MDGRHLGQGVREHYKGDLELGYRTLLSGGSAWESLRVAPRLEVAPTAHWTFLAGVVLVYHDLEGSDNTEERRVQLGTKYNFTPFKRVQTRLNLRYEYRSIRSDGEEQEQRSDRLRVRAEVVVPLDTRNFHSDTMWYAMGDVEGFVTQDQQADERFASRARMRVGLGRKFNYNWRAEAIYTMQQSRNSLTDEDPSLDNIIRLRVKYYFTPKGRKKASEPSPTG